MTEHDLEVLERVRTERTSLVVEADEPGAVADAIAADGGRRVSPSELGTWVEEASLLRQRAHAVLAAEEVVAGALAVERAARAALLGVHPPATAGGRLPSDGSPAEREGDAGHEDRDDHDRDPGADRQAVRFALAILVPAQVAGLAVYVADGTLLAVVAPAVALAYVLLVAVTHRHPPGVPGRGARPPERRARPGTGDLPLRPGTAGPAGGDAVRPVPSPPSVRAAEAHLRRQQAAWKLAWWERGLRPLDVATWVGRPDEARGAPSTIVVVDAGREVDDDVLARMTAAVPAAVRVVLVRPLPA